MPVLGFCLKWSRTLILETMVLTVRLSKRSSRALYALMPSPSGIPRSSDSASSKQAWHKSE